MSHDVITSNNQNNSEIMPLCHLCRGKVLEWKHFHLFSRVTSDCQPWPRGGRLAKCLSCNTVQKIIDSKWNHEAESVYQQYSLYYQASNAEEQSVLGSGDLKQRSVALMMDLTSHIKLPANAIFLDFGCGTGVTLKAASQLFPTWSIFGYDPSPTGAQELVGKGNIKAVVKNLNDLKSRPNLITLIHTLEHIPDPKQTLLTIKNILAPDGFVIIQVPHHPTNPFDLLITDHCTHYDLDTLSAVMRDAGFKVDFISSSVIRKEISLIATVNNSAISNSRSMHETSADPLIGVDNGLDWLETVQSSAANTAQHSERPFGIFGTAIAALWLYGQMPDQVDFFVDEDPSRHGSGRLPKPVLAPSSIPAGATVYIPLVPPIALEIAIRLEAQGISAVQPPPYPTKYNVG